MKKILMILLLIGYCLNNGLASEKKIKEIYIVGLDSKVPLFRIENGKFSASFELPYSEFGDIISKAGLHVTGQDSPEKVALSMSGTCTDGILKASGIGSFIVKIKIGPNSWDARNVTLKINWEGEESPPWYTRTFTIDQELETQMPTYESIPVKVNGHRKWIKEYRGRTMHTASNRFDLEILKKIGAADFEVFQGAYLAAGQGTLTDEQVSKLKEADARLEKVQDLIQDGKFNGAIRLLEAQIEALQILKRESDATIKIYKSPAEKVIKEFQTILKFKNQLKEQVKMAITNNDKALKALEKLRVSFSAKVVETMLRSFVSWQGSVPTAPEDLLGKYSFTTGLFDLPRSLLDWQTNAIHDATVLNNKKNTIRQLMVYEKFWGDLRDNCTEELKNLHGQLDKQGIQDVMELNSRLLKL